MSFRQRVTVLVAAAIAVTVAATSFAVWMVSKHELLQQVDQSLAQPGGRFAPLTVLVAPNGSAAGPLAGAVPVTSQVLAVARGEAEPYFATISVAGIPVREFVSLDRDAGVARITLANLQPTNRAVHRIGVITLLIGLIGIGAAAAVAAFVAGAVLRPVRRLTAAAESVAATGDLSARVEATTGDELGRLAVRFNAMLAALEESVGRQRRLVADASHELRTPLTAARTNVDLLREGKLPADEARRALDEAAVELDSLTSLVADLVELSRGEERKLRVAPVQLDDLVASAVERARSRFPHATFVTSLSPTLVEVDAELVERAILNLLDNAVKYSPAGAAIEVAVRGGEVTVADHGPGIAEEDLPRVFDRFYRAAAARSKPGSGLGLAIVREAAAAHGGRATAESSPAGARFRLVLPTA